MHPLIRAFLLDLIAFATLFTLAAALANPIVTLVIIEPQQRLERRMEKLEVSNEDTRKNLSSIDKNLAVMAESVQAIRNTLAKER